MVKYAVIEERDGVRTVTNVVVSSRNHAMKQRWIEANNLQIGMVENGGKWSMPEAASKRMSARDVILSLGDEEAEKLVGFLKQNGVISAEKADKLRVRK